MAERSYQPKVDGEWEAPWEVGAAPWMRSSLGSVGAQTATMGQLVRDVRRQERTDMRNRFLSIHMDAEVHAARSLRGDIAVLVSLRALTGCWRQE